MVTGIVISDSVGTVHCSG